MSLFTRTAPTSPLAEQLAGKAASLRSRAEADAATSQSFVEAASKAQASSENAARRAAVVEEAAAILGDAADVE